MPWNRWHDHKNGQQISTQLINAKGEVLCLRIRRRGDPDDGSADRYEERGRQITRKQVDVLEALDKLDGTPAEEKPRDSTQTDVEPLFTKVLSLTGALDPQPSYSVSGANKPNVTRTQRHDPFLLTSHVLTIHSGRDKKASDEATNPVLSGVLKIAKPTRKSQNWDQETLDATGNLPDTYWVRQARWFEAGRVFRIWLPEAKGPTAKDWDGKDNGTYATIRPWVVVKRESSYCICVPVCTYGKQGITKTGLTPKERSFHAILYDETTRPELLDAEKAFEHFLKPAFKVKVAEDASLSSISRVRFDKPRTIECNLKVRNVGQILGQDEIGRLQQYCNEACMP